MFGRKFELNDETLHIVEEIGRHMPGGFFIYKAEDDQSLLYVNGAVLDIFGCDNIDEFRELTGYTFQGMVHPDDYKEIVDSISDQIKGKEENLDYVEYRIITRDGRVRWVEDYGHFTETEYYGGIYYVFISDITEKREQTESDKATRQAVIEALMESYHTVWLIKDLKVGNISLYRGDTEGKTIHSVPIRRALEQMYYPQAKKYYIETTVDPSDQERLQRELSLENIARRLKEEIAFNINYLRVMDDGSKKYFRIEFARVDMPGGQVGVVCGFKDIDVEVRKSLDQYHALRDALAAAEQANLAKTAFLSNMSHEIRTPMNAIIGLNSIAMKEEGLPDSTREYLRKIDSSATHLLSIINDILDMSRIESGKVIVKNEEFSFSRIIDQVNTMIGEQCKEKGLSYECRCKGQIDHYYIGDDVKLRQVLINILGNAVKFTPEGGRVLFRIEEKARFGRKVTLSFIIEDSGIGMSEEYLPHLFDTFSQEDYSSTSRFGSTGLGMAITKNIVELMNGQIDVKSKKGVGTTFTVTLTFEETREKDLQPPDQKPDAEEPASTGLAGRRILLAEDISVNAEIIILILSMRDVKVDLAHNGREAVDMFENSAPEYYDAILMDMRMPEMDGLEATRLIRAMDRQDARLVPIIALTANAFDEDVQRSLQAGLDAHLTKPVEAESLYGTLEELINLGSTAQ